MKPTEILEMANSCGRFENGTMYEDALIKFTAALEARWREELRVDAEPVLYMFTVDGKYYTAKNKAHAESMLRHPDTHLYPDKPEDFPLTPLYPSSALIAARQAGRDEQREVDAKICDVYTIVNYPYFCKSHKSGAILCAKAIRNQQPSEGEKA
jgi:hypothetical protein